MPGVIVTDPFERLLLERAQQLALKLRRYLAHLVEEQRATMGSLEPAYPVTCRPGERPLGVSEELAFEQIPGNRRTVYGDELTVRAGAPVMNALRDQLLADAGLAEDQDGRVGIGDSIGVLKSLP